MANERLTLQIDAKSTGQAEIEKLAASLNKVVSISERVGQRQNNAPIATGFEQFPQQIKQLVENPIASAESTVARFASSFGPVGLIASGAVAGLTSFALASEGAARRLADLGVSVRDTALKTGLSVKEVSQFGFAARAVGQDVTVFEGGLRKLSQALADSGPEGDKARKGLAELGVVTREINGELKPTSSIFQQIATGLGKMGSAAERNSEVVKIFGRGGIELIPVLERLNELLAVADEHGFKGISEDDIARYGKIKDRLNEIDTVWMGLKRRLEDGIVGRISFVYGEVRNALAGAVVGAETSSTLGSAVRGAGGFASSAIPGVSALSAGYKSLSGLAEAQQGLSVADRVAAQTKAQYAKAEPPSAEALAGATYMGRAQSSFENTLPGAEQAASKAKSAAEAAHTAFTSATGSGVPYLKKLEEEWQRLESVAKTYEDRVKAIQQAQSQSKAARENEQSNIQKFREEGQKLSGVDEIPEVKLRHEYEARLAAININKGGQYTPLAQQTGRSELFAGYIQGQTTLRRKRNEDMSSVGNEALATSSQELQKYGEQLAAGFRDSLTQGDIVGRTPLEAAALTRIPQISRQATSAGMLKDLSQDTAHAERMAQIGGGHGDEVAVQQKLADIRTDAADKELQLHRNLASLKIIDDQALEDAELDHERRLNDIRYSNIETLGQLRKDQLDREVSLATGLVRSAFGGGKGVANFAKDFAMNTGETVLSNFLKSNPKMLDGMFPHAKEGSTLGTLFKGTPFGPDANKASIASVTLNTTETQLNTVATQGLTAAISQMSTGSGSSTGSGRFGNLGGMAGLFPDGVTGSGEAGVEGNGIPGSPEGPDSGSGESSGSSSVASNSTRGSGFSGMLGGLSHTGDVRAVFTGSTNSGTQLTGAEQAGAAIGTAGVVLGGVEAAYSGFKKGGARGNLQGISAVTGTAAALDPEPISKAVLAGVALVSSFVGSVLGDPKQMRQEFIDKTLGNAKYEAPAVKNVNMGVGGGYSDYSAWGNVRSSNLSPYPTGQSDPSQWYRNGQYNQLPGSSGTPYGSNITVNIQAFDAQNVMDHGADIANALIPQFSTHTGLAMAATKATVGG